jgi:hypothetical protein
MDTTTPQATTSKQLDIFFKENVLFISDFNGLLVKTASKSQQDKTMIMK